MAFQGISTGTGPNQGDGTTLSRGAVIINSNFSEVYDALGDGTTINSTIEPDAINTGSIVGTALTVNGDVYVTETLDVDGDVTLGSGVTITGVLDVNTSAEIDNVRIDGNTVDTTSGNLTLDSADGLVDINDNVDISGTLDVDGNVTLGNASSDTVTINGTTTVTNNLTVDGDVDLGSDGSDTIDANGRFGTSLIPNSNNTRDLGDGSRKWKNLYLSGSATVDTNLTVTNNLTVTGNTTLGNDTGDTVTATGDLTAAGNITGARVRLFDNTVTTISENDGLTLQSFNFNGVNVKGPFTTDGNTTLGDDGFDTHTLNGDTTINGSVTLSGTLNADGAVNLGNEDTDTITATGQFDSNLIPSDDNTYNLGSDTHRWGNLWIQGTANIDTATVDTLTVTGNTTLGNDDTDTITIKGITNIDNVRIDGDSIYQSVLDTTNLTLYSNGGGIVEVNDSLTVNQSLTVIGNTSLGDLSNDTTTVTGILDVNGSAEIDNVRIDNSSIYQYQENATNLTLYSNGGGIVQVSDSLKVTASLTVDGNTTLGNSETNDSHTINGDTTINGDLTVTGDVAIEGSSIYQSVSDNTNLTLYSNGGGIVQVSDSLKVTASLTVDGNTTLGNSETNDSHTINGDTTINGDLTVTGDVSGIDATSIKDSNDTVRAQATTSGVTITGDMNFSNGNGGFTGMLKEKFHQNFSNQISSTEIHLEDGNVQVFSANQTGGSGDVSIRYGSGVNLADKLADGEMVTVTIIAQVTDGTSFYPNFSLRIDGSLQPTFWVGGSAPTTGGNGTGTLNQGYDIYNFTILRRGGGWNVIASQGITVP